MNSPDDPKHELSSAKSVSMRRSHIGNANAFGDGNTINNVFIGGGQDSTAEKRRSPFQIPDPPADFVGRTTELTQLRDGIACGGVAISGLAGMGGIGKTVLACQLARTLSPDYPDAELYLDLRGVEASPMSVAEALRQIIFAFAPTAQLPDDIEQLRELYLSLLRDKRAIVLLDNAKDAAQVKPLLPPATCAAIVTSRQYFVVSELGLKPQRLEKLAPPDATNLLLKIAPRIGDEAEEMARALGYLPLALRLAASALAERDNLTPQRYLQRLSEAETRLGLTDTTRAENEPRTIEAILRLSYNLLDADSQTRWRMLAVFADSFNEAAAAALWQTDADAASDVLGDLRNFSMVDFDPTNNRYVLHDLSRDFAAALLSADEVEDYSTRKRHAIYYSEIIEITSSLILQGNDAILHGLRLFDEERTNIECGQSWAVSQALSEEDAARLCIIYPNAGVYALQLRQAVPERIDWLEAALANARNMGEWQGEGISLGNLGIAHANLGNAKRAIELHKQALTILHEVGDSRGKCAALGSLSEAYLCLGEIHLSIETYEQCLAIARRIGSLHHECASLGGLGCAFVCLGEARRGIEFHNQHLNIARKIGDRRGEGCALGNLGVAYGHLGEAHRVIEFHEQHLAITREIGDRQGEGNALSSLGCACTHFGELHRAIELHQKRLVIAQEIGDRRGEGNTLGNLGVAYAKLGEIHRAIDFHKRALVIAREIGDRRGEASDLNDLGTAYAGLGEHLRAVELHKQALITMRKVGDQRGEAIALFNMSLCSDELGQPAQAIKLAVAALQIFEKIESSYAENVQRQLEEWRNAERE